MNNKENNCLNLLKKVLKITIEKNVSIIISTLKSILNTNERRLTKGIKNGINFKYLIL